MSYWYTDQVLQVTFHLVNYASVKHADQTPFKITLMRERELTCTGKSISGVSSYADAVVATWDVSTVSEFAAVAAVHSAFVNVWNSTNSLLANASSRFIQKNTPHHEN